MGTMTRAQFAKLLQEGLNTVFGLEYKKYAEEWRGCYDVETSTKAFEEDQMITGFGAAGTKSEGAGVKFDEAQQGWAARYTHETIALAFAVTQEAIEDNLYMSMGSKYAKALAKSMQETKEIKGAAIFNNATTNLIGDGQSMLSTAHPLTGGGTASNMLPTGADFSESALEDLLIQMRKSVDDRGIPIAIKAKSIILPPELEYVAHRILRTKLRPGTSDNDANAIKDKGIFSSDPKIITRFTSPSNWFVKTDVNDGLKHINRKSLKRTMDTEFETGNYRYQTRERYSFGITDWRGIFGSA
jgi:hypothetical protein